MQSTALFSVNDEAENVPELLLLVGPPACGKSTLARSLHRTHFRVNQDLLKSKKACFKAATEHFKTVKEEEVTSPQPQGVVVDATNANRSVRKEWIELARDLAVV